MWASILPPSSIGTNNLSSFFCIFPQNGYEFFFLSQKHEGGHGGSKDKQKTYILIQSIKNGVLDYDFN